MQESKKNIWRKDSEESNLELFLHGNFQIKPNTHAKPFESYQLSNGL